MDNRQQILLALRQTTLPELPLPQPEFTPQQFSDPVEHFVNTVGAVGGTVVEVETESAIAEHVARCPSYAQAERMWSLIDAVPSRPADWDGGDDPHTLGPLDFFLARGQLGVAENGAIWVTDADVPLRAALFLTQHLGLLIRRDQIVHNLHEAYERLTWADTPFGTFLSGPSKTADIEQSLVMGAQGARSLTVLLCPAVS